MSGDSTDGQQRSIDQQDSELTYQDSQQILPLDDDTKSHGDTAKNHTDRFVTMNGAQRGIAGDHVRDRRDLPGACGYLGEYSTLQNGVPGLSSSDDHVGASTTLQKNFPGLPGHNVESKTFQRDSPGRRYLDGATVQKDLADLYPSQGLLDYVRGSSILQNASHGQHVYVVGNATLPDSSQGLRNYVKASTILQSDLPGLYDTAGGNTTLEKDLPGLRGSVGGRTTLHKDVPGLSSNARETRTSNDAWNQPYNDTRLEDNAYPSTDSRGGLYSGRSVSVQMRSNSQSSMRGSMNHSPSFGNTSPSAGELRRDSFLRMERLGNNFDTVLDPTQRIGMPKSEHTSQDSSKEVQRYGQRSSSLETNRSYEEDTRWESALWTGARGYDSWHHKQRSYGSRQSSTASSFSYSMEELVGMMRCMWKFRKMLSEIEDRLEEEQTSVVGALSDEQRTDVEDILELRTAVKREADLLEQQLNDLLQAYDDNLKMKMNRLLDEQTHLCSELKWTPHSASHPGHASTKSIGIQCNLLPARETPESRVFPQRTDGSHFIYSREWNPDSKADKLNFVEYINSYKDVSF